MRAPAPRARRSSSFAAAPAAPLPGIPQLDVAGKGTWQREGSSSRYNFTFQTERGKNEKASALLQGEELLVTSGGMTMVFVRTY